MTLDPFDLNLRHIRSVVAIAKLGSIRAAATEVCVSQPALTQGVAKLEKQFGAKMFIRYHDGMKVTPLGAVVAARASAALANLAAVMPSTGRRKRERFSNPELLVTMKKLRAYLRFYESKALTGFVHDTTGSSTMLRAVRDLEQLTGISLLERRKSGPDFTPAGRLLARGIRLAVRELEAAITETRAEKGQNVEKIHIGAMPLCRAIILPKAIVNFGNLAPQVPLTIVEGGWRELVRPLEDGELDMVVGALRGEALSSDLIELPLFTDRLVVAARAGHPLANNPDCSLSDLARFPWIIGPSGSPLRKFWDAMFTETGRPAHLLECGSIMVIYGVLADSDHLTLVSPDQVAIGVKNGILTHIGPPRTHAVREIGVMMRRNWRPPPLQELFLDTLRKTVTELRGISPQGS